MHRSKIPAIRYMHEGEEIDSVCGKLVYCIVGGIWWRLKFGNLVSRWKLAKFNSSPTFLCWWRREERRLYSSMCDSVHGFCVWETGIVWHLLCNDHDLFLFCVYFTNEYHYYASVCESCCRTSLLRRKVTGEEGPATKLKFGPTLTQSFSHMSCRSWAQSFVSYHLMYWSRMCCNLRSLRTHMSGLEHHYWHGLHSS